MPRRRTRLAVALGFLLALVAAAPSARAQDLPEPGEGFAWERVGDRPIDARDLAFGPDGTLWVAGGRRPYRLDLSGGFPGTWVDLLDSGRFETVLPLGRGPEGDTLVATAVFSTKRSVDGGQTWAQVHNRGDEGLYEFPPGSPFAGRILTGDNDQQPGAVAFSDDRGASFTPSVLPGEPGWASGADAFVALPPSAAHPGRVLAAGPWGVTLSDDGGQTFTESGLHEVLYYVGEEIGLVERPGGGGFAAIMGGRISAQPYRRVWVSADEGETWGPELGVPLPEGPPEGVGGRVAGVLPLGGASAFLVLGKGTVYRTGDAGATWEAVGRAPDITESSLVSDAAVGPDGRLYVALQVTGPEEEWVWRTGEVVVASEPGAPEPAGEPLRVAVAPNPSRGSATVTLTLPQPGEAAVALYDVLGRRVAVLHEGPLAAGRHEWPVDASALPPGVYVVRVAAGGATAARTLTRLR